jgi:biopolymer transport protein ExbD
MKFKRTAEDEPVGFQVASMIDIVFLLLIFFIVASQLQELEFSKEVELPIADASQTKKSEGMQEIRLNVLDDGTIKVGDDVFPPERVAAELRRVAEDSSMPVKVLLRGDQEAHYGRIMRIMRSCAEANLWNISFATFQEPPQETPVAP